MFNVVIHSQAWTAVETRLCQILLQNQNIDITEFCDMSFIYFVNNNLATLVLFVDKTEFLDKTEFWHSIYAI